MWKKTAKLLVFLSVGLNLAFGVFWVVHRFPMPSDGTVVRPGAPTDDPIWHPLYRELNLTEQQWEEIAPRLAAFVERSRTLCRSCQQLRGDILELMQADEPDMELIRGKQKDILEKQGTMQSMVIEHILAEKQILSSQQRDLLFHLIRQRTGGRGGCLLRKLGQCGDKCSNCASGSLSKD